MKKIISKWILGMVALAAPNAYADSYVLYCNTLTQVKAIAPSWVTNVAVDSGLKSLGYTMIRDSDFRGSDFKQVSVSAAAPNSAEALRIAVTSVCHNERVSLERGLIDRFSGGRVPLDAQIYQCAYVYDTAGRFIIHGCPVVPLLQVR